MIVGSKVSGQSNNRTIRQLFLAGRIRRNNPCASEGNVG
jgi:hypothetical protein